MLLTSNGGLSFTLKTKNGVVVFSPTTESFPSSASLVLYGKPGDAPGLPGIPEPGKPFLIEAPGEYEVGGTSVFGYRTPEGVAYVVQAEDMTICHLGPLASSLDEKFAESLGAIDVLMVPVVGNGVLDAKGASAIISLIEPGYVVPMGFTVKDTDVLRPSAEGLRQEVWKALGVNPTPQSNLALVAGGVPVETQIVSLVVESK